MFVIICIDDNNGMIFNQRRQSQDKVLQEYMLQLTKQTFFWMNSYTKKQFSNSGATNITVDEDFLANARTGDYCFVENTDIEPYIHKIEKIIIFKWNRTYPADTYFSLDLSEWILEDTEEFKGHSHDKITKEIYRK